MSLQYIFGGSGCGKTYRCIEELSEKTKSNKNIIYIVPEQFTLQAEKDIINFVHSSSIVNIQVLSFKRMSYRLFSETGIPDKKNLEELGKLMLIRKIIYELSDKLLYFNKSADKQGFIDSINKTISEFYRYEITPHEISLSIEKLKNDDVLYSKLSDIHLIYKTFKDYISQNFISDDETLDLLAEKIPKSNFFENTEIWIDGFNGFTPQEFSVLKELLKKAEKITISLCINNNSISYQEIKNYDPFFEIKASINKLSSIASETKTKIPKPIFLKENLRYKNNKELLFLSENFLKYTKKEFSAPMNNIEIINCKNYYNELEMTAVKIFELIYNNNYKYSDIAVILCSDSYENPLKSIFGKYKIPYFIDNKKGMDGHPLTEFILSVFEMLSSNMAYEPIFRFLKTGLTEIDSDEISILENYVLAYGIRGKKWFYEHWDYGFDNNKNFCENDINYIKDCFTEIIGDFIKFLKSKPKHTVKDISMQLIKFLSKNKIEKVLMDWVNSAKENNPLTASEHIQVWNMIMNITQKSVEIFGDREVTPKEYAKIINSAISNSTIGLLPPTQDELIVGTLKRTRTPNIKALFLLGVNDGIIPSFNDEDTIFNDSEKELLAANGMELSPISLKSAVREQFDIYRIFSKAENKLFLSYPTGGLDGKPKRPSSILAKIKKLFPTLEEYSFEPENQITLPIPTFENLVRHLNDYANGTMLDESYKDIYIWFKNSKTFSKYLKMTESFLFSKRKENYISRKVVKKLYGNEIRSSVSKLEDFSKCPYMFFVKYGLKAKERKIYELTSPDLGIIFHTTIEKFSNELENKNKNWRNMSTEEINSSIDKIVDEISETQNNAILLSSGKYKHMVQNIKRVTKRSINVLAEHIKCGDFEPLGYEIGFGAKEKLPPVVIDLKDGMKLILTGKIDRIDIYNSNNNTYVKIIDYKTYKTSYNLTYVYYGLQLQLLTYLDAVIKTGTPQIGNNLLVGGMFYFTIDDPIISKVVDNTEELESEIQKMFKLNGLLINDKEISAAMDKNLITSLNSNIIPAKLKKDGDFNQKGTSAVSPEDFDTLRKYVIEVATDIGNEILKGNIQIYPADKISASFKTNACTYCPYNSICQFESSNKENQYRKIKTLKEPITDIKEFLDNH